MAVTSALLPISQIVDELNAFQPAMLGGYSTILELLMDEQKKGRLRISPVIIMTGGEYLSNPMREKLSEAFQCYVQTNYSCIPVLKEEQLRVNVQNNISISMTIG